MNIIDEFLESGAYVLLTYASVGSFLLCCLATTNSNSAYEQTVSNTSKAEGFGMQHQEV